MILKQRYKKNKKKWWFHFSVFNCASAKPLQQFLVIFFIYLSALLNLYVCFIWLGSMSVLLSCHVKVKLPLQQYKNNLKITKGRQKISRPDNAIMTITCHPVFFLFLKQKMLHNFFFSEFIKFPIQSKIMHFFSQNK